MFKNFRIIFIIALMAILTACHNTKKRPVLSTPEHKISKLPVHKGKVFSLDYCIAKSLEQRTDYEIYTQNKRINDEKVTAKTLGVLYEQAKHFYFINRSLNSSSYSIGNTINIKQVEKSLDILDFSMAYLNSSREKDKKIIATAQKLRIKQKIKLAVTEIYLKAALYQYLIKTIEKSLLQYQKREKVLMNLERSKKLSPIRLLNEKKRFIRLEKSLIQYRRNYQNVCRELRIMMGLVKSKKVDTACLEKLSVPSLPDINTLEKIALLERPEFSGLNIIITDDLRKTIVKMFSRFKISLSRKNYVSYFLQWKEIGTCSAYALLKLPQKLASYRALTTEKYRNSMRELALAVGITAQVRMAHVSFLQAKERYDLAKKTYKAYKNQLEIDNKKAILDKTISKLELEGLKFEAHKYFIKRLVSLCDYYLAYCRLLDTIGVDSINPALIEKAKNSKAQALDKEIIKKYIKIVKPLIDQAKKRSNEVKITKDRCKVL